jgi:methylmalonyl-CoA/ethylmalonyl-CoA epimerase
MLRHMRRVTEPKLHHVGYVVASVQESSSGFIESLGAKADSGIIHDPLQKVFVQFLRLPAEDEVRIELVAPAEPDSPVRSFLEKGGGLHHLCYEVRDLELALDEARSRKCVLVRSPKPAAAFAGRRIAWVITPEKLLIEYLEAQHI